MSDYRLVFSGASQIVRDDGTVVADAPFATSEERIGEGATPLTFSVNVAFLPPSGGGKTVLDFTEILQQSLPYTGNQTLTGWCRLDVSCDVGTACAVWASLLPPGDTSAAVPAGVVSGASGVGVGTSFGLLTPPASAAAAKLYLFGCGLDEKEATNVVVNVTLLTRPA